ncbi:MAG TPA: hypothetical protein VEY51_00740 [Chondromyces sp.]|nr:hypothetical protein [Chondromyces sp.]
MLAEFVISPVRFFMASSAFLAAFWCLGDLFRESMAAVRALFNKRVEPALFFLLIIACMFFVFSMMNNVLAILLFSFSAVYGMISLEKKRVWG